MAEIEKNAVPAEKKADKKPANKKPSIFSRIAKFFREYRAELKKVTWASREETMKNTFVVAVTIVIAGAAIGILDFAFTKGLDLLVGIIH